MVYRRARVRSNPRGRDAQEIYAGNGVTKETIDGLIQMTDMIQEYVDEMRRMVSDLMAPGFSDKTFKLEELVRFRKTDGPMGIVRASNDDGWVGVEWSHSATEWVRSDDLERA